MISPLYIDRAVTPSTKAVCQENKDDATCFHTGVAFCPLAIMASFSFLAALIESARIGRLFEMARKNVLADIASEGNSRATC